MGIEQIVEFSSQTRVIDYIRSQKTRVAICMAKKGGAGKTTSTKLLAQGCANEGLRVLVVDFDEQCSMSLSLGSPEHANGERYIVPAIWNEAWQDITRHQREVSKKYFQRRSSALDLVNSDLYAFSHPTTLTAEYFERINRDKGSQYTGGYVDIVYGHKDIVSKSLHLGGNEDLFEQQVQIVKAYFDSEYIQNSYDIVFVDVPPSTTLPMLIALRCSTDILMLNSPRAMENTTYLDTEELVAKEIQRRRSSMVQELDLVNHGILPVMTSIKQVATAAFFNSVNQDRLLVPQSISIPFSKVVEYSAKKEIMNSVFDIPPTFRLNNGPSVARKISQISRAFIRSIYGQEF